MQIEESMKEKLEMEMNFPCINMSTDERDFCLRILNNCKEITDSDNKVNDVGKGTIIHCYFRKDGDVIKANGPFFVGTGNNAENRWLDAEIYITDKSIIVDMLVDIILTKEKYRVLDVFTLKKGILNRESQYDYNIDSTNEKIIDEKMKGRLK